MSTLLSLYKKVLINILVLIICNIYYEFFIVSILVRITIQITLYISISESLSSEYLDAELIFSLVARLPSIGMASSLISLTPPVPWLSESSDVCKEYTKHVKNIFIK